MNTTLFRYLVSSAFLLTSASTCLAQRLESQTNPVLPAPVSSVFLISSPTAKSCASAFLDKEGRLITNSHVVESLCPQGQCLDIELYQAETLAQKPAKQAGPYTITIERESPALDLAILKVAWAKPQKGVFDLLEASTPPYIGQTVFNLGFPGCEKLEMSSGELTGLSKLSFFSSAKGSHGSSGSPVFDEKQRLVGIVGQSSSFWGAVAAITLGLRFETRGTKATTITQALSLPPEDAIYFEAQSLLQSYKEDVRPLSGIERLWASTRFIGNVEALRREAYLVAQQMDAQTSKDSWPFILMGEYFGYLKRIKLSASEHDNKKRDTLISLITAYNLELLGANERLFKPLNKNILAQDSLNQASDAGSSIAQIGSVKELISYAMQDKYPGMEMYCLRLALLSAIIIIPVLLLWAVAFIFIIFKLRAAAKKKRAKSL